MSIEYSCPQCSKIVRYANKHSAYMAKRRKSKCKTCVKQNKLGETNPFYGKSHSNETKSNLATKAKSRVLTEEHKAKITAVLRASNFKTPLYEHWFAKYGKEVADKKYLAMCEKHSINNKGEGNPMFGRPSPEGSGNGWSGWYKGWFFRSLRELSFVINFVEKNKFSWQSCESKQFRITYLDLGGQKRTYFPDFLVNGKFLVEIKPESLQKSQIVQNKCFAAKQFSLTNGYHYAIMDYEVMPEEQLHDLVSNGIVVFTEKYRKKYEGYSLCRRKRLG